jgi:RecA-family ATPase
MTQLGHRARQHPVAISLIAWPMTDALPPKPQTYNGDLTKLPPPLEHLREQQVWVCWRWFWNGKKWTKPPYRADNPDRNASSSDPATWGTYEQAIEQVHIGRADGIGIALKGLNLGGVDLDHCRDPATCTIDPWAEERLHQFQGAYVEATVSGKGLRILGTSALEGFAPKFKLADKGNGAAIELFSNSHHYLTLSCNELSTCKELPPIGDKMAAIAAELSGKHNGLDFNAAPSANDVPHVNDAPHVAPETEPAPQNETAWSFTEETRLRSALDAIPTDEKLLAEKFGHAHDTWVKIGRAIERLDWGERGFAIFRDWSAQNAQEFDERGLRTQWASFNRNRGAREKPTTIATVYLYAIKFGWRGDAEISKYGEADQEAPAPLPWLDMSNWDREPVPEREWAILDRVPLNQAGLFSGEGGTGKSIIELTKNIAHVAGKDWLGSMPECGPAIYIGAEDDEKELHIRLATIAKHYGVTFEELIAGGLHVLCLLGQDATLCAAGGKSGKVEVTELYRQVYEAAGDIKPKNISIDTLSRAFAGSEIDRVQVYAFAMHMQALAMAAGGSVTVLSHPSLQGISSGSGISGSTAWHGAFRFRQYLTSVKSDDGEQPDNDLRQLEFKKNQYGPKAETVVVRYQHGLFLPVPGIGSLEKVAQEQEDDERFLAALDQAEKQGRHLSDNVNANNYAPASFSKATGTPKARLAGAMERLFTAGKIQMVTYGPPSKAWRKLARKT